MLPIRFSRRRLLGSILAALTGRLFPQPPRTIDSTPRPTPPLRHALKRYPVVVATYSYDNLGRLRSVTDYPFAAPDNGARLSQSWACQRLGECTVYRYDGCAALASEKSKEDGIV